MQPSSLSGRKARLTLLPFSWLVAFASVAGVLKIAAAIRGINIRQLLTTDTLWPLAIVLPAFFFGKVLGLITMNLIGYFTPLRHTFERERRETGRHGFATAMTDLVRIVLVLFVLTVAGLVAFLSITDYNRHVKVSAIPFERQLQMREGDALEFELPDGKTVAVWCERQPSGFTLGEQTTASGLKTAWGERSFKRPEVVREQISPNSYRLAGWKSYISQGAVTTAGDQTTEYVLYVGDLQFSIIENLRGTPSLPVTIRITRK